MLPLPVCGTATLLFTFCLQCGEVTRSGPGGEGAPGLVMNPWRLGWCCPDPQAAMAKGLGFPGVE